MEKLTPEMLGGLFALWQDGKRTLAEVHAEVAMHASAWAADCKARDYYVAEMRLAEDRAEKAGARVEALEKALYDAIEEGGCPQYEIEMDDETGRARPAAIAIHNSPAALRGEEER